MNIRLNFHLDSKTPLWLIKIYLHFKSTHLTILQSAMLLSIVKQKVIKKLRQMENGIKEQISIKNETKNIDEHLKR